MNSESDALNRAILKEFLADQGWAIGQDGEIITPTGRTLFEPGFVTAIRKVLKT
ncbi:gamma-mobile-trio protein GmtX [Rhodoferax antarcticus]|uniref:gamma-mobile-trio protein GmtX n=1 Tax=Rhodoferax antarcticus TaxID=81479 RepID=UPI003B845271